MTGSYEEFGDREARIRKALDGVAQHLATYLVLGALLYAAVIQFPEGQRQWHGWLSTGELIALSWVFREIYGPG